MFCLDYVSKSHNICPLATLSGSGSPTANFMGQIILHLTSFCYLKISNGLKEDEEFEGVYRSKHGCMNMRSALVH